MEFNNIEGKNRMKSIKFIKYFYSTIYSTLCRTLSYLSRLSSLLFLACNNNKTSLHPAETHRTACARKYLQSVHYIVTLQVCSKGSQVDINLNEIRPK